MEGVLVVMGSARTLSEHCRCTLEQCTEPQNTHIGTWNELISVINDTDEAARGSSTLSVSRKGIKQPSKKKKYSLYCLHALIM